MQKILGLDLGTNSIGYAIRTTDSYPNQIISKGVLTFEKGVATTKNGEEPAVKKRTESRGRRRNYQAEKYRKWQLLETLINTEPQMCPLTIDELNRWRKYKKDEERVYPNNNKKFIDWLRLDFDGDNKIDFENPYHLRKEATEKKFSNPMIAGRALYHLVQRRGFRGRDEEESKTIIEGSKDLGITGVDVIHKIMEEKNTTLGGALYHENKEGKRIRKRYNIRTDFEKELKIICGVQEIDEESELYKRIYKAIIWQRPLRTQKGNIGRCTFEPTKQRCPVSHPLYEEFRAWCFINNIKTKRIDSTDKEFEFLSNEQKNEIFEKLFFRKSKPQFDFLDIIKLLDKKDSLIFNYERNATNKQIDITEILKLRKSKSSPYITVTGCPISAALKDIFTCDLKDIKIPHPVNNKRSNKKDFYDYIDIWHVLFSFESKEKLEQFAREQLELNDEQTKNFLKIKLNQGYANLSVNVIKKILPYLKQGFIYTETIYLSNLPKVFGHDLTIDEIEEIVDGIQCQFKLHKKKKEETGIINELISDYLNLPSERQIGNYASYILIENDYKTVEEKFIKFYGAETWNELPVEEKERLREVTVQSYHKFLQMPKRTDKNLLFHKVPRLDELIKDYLRHEFDIGEDDLKYLYHPSEIEAYPIAPEKNGKKYLGDPMPLSRGFKNPMAMKTLHHLKKLINYLLEHESIDNETRIVIEIARELNDANRRKAIFFWQKNREEENKKYRDDLTEKASEHKVDIDVEKIENIYKFRLWVEQEYKCMYTGKPIGFASLFNGNEIELEHTIPASISFDNELSNLTLCYKKYNNDIKKKQIPAQCPNYDSSIIIDLSDGQWECTPIKERIKKWQEKVDHLKKNIESNKKQTKNPSLTKENKDNIIVKRRMWEMDLAYWEKKLKTFIVNEYKSTWRNSQLRDTQIVTKYALPYLKTVFDKVEVQKGTITAEFRKIFNVGFEKDRSKHTHHAIDAAILTLIPPAAIRDKLLKEHFEALEKYMRFHSAPYDWRNFQPEYIRGIEEDTLVNYISQKRSIVPTRKYVRKRGKIQHLKEKLSNGTWRYKLNATGKKIPLLSQGDTIRGQLHKESFYGAIKDKDDKISFVERVMIKDFSSVDELKKIVDKTVRDVIANTIQIRIDSGKSFKEAIQEPIWMVDENGNPKKMDKKGTIISPIRHVRCMVKSGKGNLTVEKALEIKEHAMKSKHEHKQFVYAENKEMTLCLYYEGLVNGKVTKAFRFIGLFELAQYKLTRFSDISQNPEFQLCEVGRGKNKTLIPLCFLITSGTRVLIFNNTSDEIRELNRKEILKRLYRIYKFNEAPVPIMYLQFHAEARPNDQLGTGETQINLDKYQPRLKLVANSFKCLIEGKDFDIMLDGEIILK